MSTPEMDPDIQDITVVCLKQKCKAARSKHVWQLSVEYKS